MVAAEVSVAAGAGAGAGAAEAAGAMAGAVGALVAVWAKESDVAARVKARMAAAAEKGRWVIG